jgi:hypothetical protein
MLTSSLSFAEAAPTGYHLAADNTMASENRAPEVEAVAILFLLIAWITIGLRCYVRLFITKLFRIDDCLAVATLVCRLSFSWRERVVDY